MNPLDILVRSVLLPLDYRCDIILIVAHDDEVPFYDICVSDLASKAEADKLLYDVNSRSTHPFTWKVIVSGTKEPMRPGGRCIDVLG